MKYDAMLVVRCTKKLRRTVDQWAKQNNVKPTEVTRRILEVAFGVDSEEVPIPPGVTSVKPTQAAPEKG